MVTNAVVTSITLKTVLALPFSAISRILPVNKIFSVNNYHTKYIIIIFPKKLAIFQHLNKVGC